MAEYIDLAQPVFKTITFFAQMLRPGERMQLLRQTAETSGRAVRRPRAFDRGWPTFRLEGIRYARGAGRRRQHVNNSDKDPVFLFLSQATQLQRSLTCSRNGDATKTMRL